MTNGTDPKSFKFITKLSILVGFVLQVVNEIFFSMSEDELQYWSGKKEKIRQQIREIFNITDSYVKEKEQWARFYQKHFAIGLPWDNTLKIPKKPVEGNWGLVIISQGLTLNQVYGAMSKAFKCWTYNDNLNKAVPINIRDTKTAYAIWVREGLEPDEKYLGKSTNQADPGMNIGVTLLERMIMEIQSFDWTGKHLDVKGSTLCTGSRCSDGRVPCVGNASDDRGVMVHWYSSCNTDSIYGLREAVSL